MSDQRKETRKKLTAFTLVYELRPRALLGYLIDLTMGGAQVEGEHAMEVNKALTLAIEFPSGLPEIPDFPFTISARVARCNKDESAHYYKIGLAFVEVTPEQAKVIEAMTGRYTFQREDSE